MSGVQTGCGGGGGGLSSDPSLTPHVNCTYQYNPSVLQCSETPPGSWFPDQTALEILVCLSITY